MIIWVLLAKLGSLGSIPNSEIKEIGTEFLGFWCVEQVTAFWFEL